MKVTLITPVYNGIGTIERTINSVLNQTYSNIEYIIIDGASTDGTREFVEENYLECISYFISEPDSGIYEAINKGVRKSTGDIVGIINSDDWLECDAIQSVVDTFGRYEADIVYGKIDLVYEDHVEEHINGRLASLCFEMAIPHPATFMRRAVYDKYEYDEKYKIAADYELVLRLYSKGFRFIEINKLLAHFSMNGISNSQSRLCENETSAISRKYMRYDIWECLLKYYLDGDNGRIFVYGIGKRGRWFVEHILSHCDVEYKIVDSDILKQGILYHGIRIEAPTELYSVKQSLVVVTPQASYQTIADSVFKHYPNARIRKLSDICEEYASAFEKEILNASCTLGSRS